MLSFLCRARGACAAALPLLVVLLLGCNAFDDRPDDGAIAGPRFAGSGAARPTATAPVAIPGTAAGTAAGTPIDECLTLPGTEQLGPACTECACEADPATVLGCNGTCFGLFACVAEACDNDGSDIACIVNECVELLSAASSATELSNLLSDACAGVCDGVPGGRPAPVTDECSALFTIDPGDDDAGLECEITLPRDAVPADFLPERAFLSIETDSGRHALARLDDASLCDDEVEGFAFVDEDVPPTIALCPAACAAGPIEVNIVCSVLPE